MKRSELIAILQKQTADYRRDGEVEIWIFDDVDKDPILMTIIGTNVAAGSGDAITMIEAGRPLSPEKQA